MSQIYAPTRKGKSAMFREALANARARGDVGMVRAMKVELAMLGETTEPEPLETAVPVKPRRGRRPLPRCEHGMILMRCPDCSPEEVVA